MALTKAEIIESIHDQIGFPKQKCSEIFETVLETMKSSLENGEDVMISRFGKFSVREKGERKGRNPQTGESVMIAPRKVIKFKSSSKLRDIING